TLRSRMEDIVEDHRERATRLETRVKADAIPLEEESEEDATEVFRPGKHAAPPRPAPPKPPRARASPSPANARRPNAPSPHARPHKSTWDEDGERETETIVDQTEIPFPPPPATLVTPQGGNAKPSPARARDVRPFNPDETIKLDSDDVEVL